MSAAHEDAFRLPTAPPGAVRRWARGALSAHRGAVAIVVALLVVVTAAQSAVPALVGLAVTITLESGDRTQLGLVVGGIVLAAVVGAAAQSIGHYRSAALGESVLHELRGDVYRTVVRLPSVVVDRVGTGEIVARSTGDVEILARAVRQSVPIVIIGSFFGVGLMVALVLTDVRLAAVGITTIMLVAFPGGRWYLRHAPGRYRHEREVEAERSATLLEHYAGRRTLWTFGATDVSKAAAKQSGQAVLDANMATTAARNRLRPSLDVAQGVAVAAVVGVGAWLLRDGAIGAGALTAGALYALRLREPLSMLLEQLDEAQQAQAALARIIGLTEGFPAPAVAERAPVNGGAALDDDGGFAVSVDAVSFGYEPGRDAVAELSLKIPEGQRVLVVGGSGAGKSTLAGLIAGLHRPDAGRIAIGQHDPATTPADERRRLVALVSQDQHVFARSVVDNVTIGNPLVSGDRIEESLRLAGAWGWVEALDGGLDTVIGTEHDAITPARAQQLNVARVLCLDAPVLLLDEATSDLDPATAALAESRLREALAGRTMITIAHRLDAAPEIDRVVMLADGRVVADGLHDDLVVDDGPYARLWSAWAGANRSSSR